MEITNPVKGEWKCSNSIWYTSELTLDDNGTFKFHDQGCYGQNFTEGRWINSDGAILLTSYDTYRRTDETTAPTQTLIETPTTKSDLEKGKVEVEFISLKELDTPIFPGPNDTIRVFFNQVKLAFKGDTLYCVDKNEVIPQHKFTMTKNKPLTRVLH